MSRFLTLLGLLVTVQACGDSHGGAPDGHLGIDAPVIGDVIADLDAGVDAGPTSSDAGDPSLLSTQGVYGNFALRTLPTDALAYDVKWELWSDGATKRRWMIFSPGSGPIDNTDQEHWKFPVGARLVKEFTRDGTLVETRIIERIGTGNTTADYSMRTYVWLANGTEANLTLNGATNVSGTMHDVPMPAQCVECHNGEAGKVLGVSAVQLLPAMLTRLSTTGRLSVPIPAGMTFGPTGSQVAIDALGRLHGSCGHCHNPNGFAAAFNNMTLRLDATSERVDLEPGWVTTVNVPVQGNGLGATKRILPMTPGSSAIVNRISVRGTGQMPPIATKVVDSAGVTAIVAWVNSLP